MENFHRRREMQQITSLNGISKWQSLWLWTHYIPLLQYLQTISFPRSFWTITLCNPSRLRTKGKLNPRSFAGVPEDQPGQWTTMGNPSLHQRYLQDNSPTPPKPQHQSGTQTSSRPHNPRKRKRAWSTNSRAKDAIPNILEKLVKY